MKIPLIILLALSGCERAPKVEQTPGARLEAAAIARGLVADPAKVGLAGLWTSDTDRLCVVPTGKALRLGISVDYGEGQACAASGTVEQSGDKLRVLLGDCQFDAAFDGERILFPAELPAACSRLCAGRESLAALAVERLSQSVSEAATLRGPRRQPLCGG